MSMRAAVLSKGSVRCGPALAIWMLALPSLAQEPAICVEPNQAAQATATKCCVVECDANGEHCACPMVLPDGRKQPLSDRDCEALLKSATASRTPKPTRASSPADKPAKDADLVTPERRKHILDGDEHDSTSGGHRPGTGRPGKTEFPKGWSDEKIIREISDVATDPASVRKPAVGGRTVVEGTRDGVHIRVILDKDGKVVTGFPINTPKNP